MLLTVIIVFSYLFGSIPFGYIISKKVRRLDIRKFGSGNIGATNVVRILGFRWGALVFGLDFLKGFLPVFAVSSVLPNWFYYSGLILTGLSSIIGHNWPLFLRFKGGKGVSTTLGVISALSILVASLITPIVTTLLSWFTVFYLFRVVSLASILAGFVFPAVCLLSNSVSFEFKILSCLLAFFILLRHRSNFEEIVARFTKNKKGEI